MFADGGTKTFAKLLDVDPQVQSISEIWGWRIQIGDIFPADFTPAPSQYIWFKMPVDELKLWSGAAFQSVLSNITWTDSRKDSPFIHQLQDAMKNDNIDNKRLPIRFNVDMFQKDSRKSTFTIGRLTGTF